MSARPSETEQSSPWSWFCSSFCGVTPEGPGVTRLTATDTTNTPAACVSYSRSDSPPSPQDAVPRERTEGNEVPLDPAGHAPRQRQNPCFPVFKSPQFTAPKQPSTMMVDDQLFGPEWIGELAQKSRPSHTLAVEPGDKPLHIAAIAKESRNDQVQVERHFLSGQTPRLAPDRVVDISAPDALAPSLSGLTPSPSSGLTPSPSAPSGVPVFRIYSQGPEKRSLHEDLVGDSDCLEHRALSSGSAAARQEKPGSLITRSAPPRLDAEAPSKEAELKVRLREMFSKAGVDGSLRAAITSKDAVAASPAEAAVESVAAAPAEASAEEASEAAPAEDVAEASPAEETAEVASAEDVAQAAPATQAAAIVRSEGAVAVVAEDVEVAPGKAVAEEAVEAAPAKDAAETAAEEQVTETAATEAAAGANHTEAAVEFALAEANKLAAMAKGLSDAAAAIASSHPAAARGLLLASSAVAGQAVSAQLVQGTGLQAEACAESKEVPRIDASDVAQRSLDHLYEKQLDRSVTWVWPSRDASASERSVREDAGVAAQRSLDHPAEKQLDRSVTWVWPGRDYSRDASQEASNVDADDATERSLSHPEAKQMDLSEIADASRQDASATTRHVLAQSTQQTSKQMASRSSLLAGSLFLRGFSPRLLEHISPRVAPLEPRNVDVCAEAMEEPECQTSEAEDSSNKNSLRRADSAPPVMISMPPDDQVQMSLRRRARTAAGRSTKSTKSSTQLSKEVLRFARRISLERKPEEEEDTEVKPRTEGAAEELAIKLNRMHEKIQKATSRESRDFEGEADSDNENETLQEPESWLEYLARCTRCIEAAGVPATAASLFETFRTSDNLGLIFATFAKMFEVAVSPGLRTGRRGSGDLPAPPWAAHDDVPGRRWRYPYEAIRLCVGGWKAKGLWELLDKRCSRKEYLGRPCEMGEDVQRAVIVGAGPCGLRTAIELRLLGARVTVVERRKHFSRINQLHVWSWVGEDLISLGARILQPPPRDFGSNPDLLHICISDAQMLLLKVALLLGVEVLFGVDFVRAHWVDNCWTAILGPSFSAGGYAGEGKTGPQTPESFLHQVADVESPSPRAPSVLDGLTVLIGANGFGSTVGQEAGICRLGADSSRNATAIGIICNLRRTNGRAERKLRSFSLARQFYIDLFRQLQESTGAELENIVYVKSSLSHYFVMTPTPGCLIRTGVVIDGACKPLLAKHNIDQAHLDQLVQRVASFQFKKAEPAVRRAIFTDLGEQDDHPMNAQYADSGPRLFDFSQTSRAADGLVFAHPPRDSSEDDGSQEETDANDLLVALVGDALIEPFWPEGLGLIRGFFSALDASAAVAEWSRGATPGETRAHHEEAYKKLKSLAAATRKRLLHDNETMYTYLPSSRYRQFSS